MKDKTKEQLIAEIELLRKEVAELEQEKAERKWAEEGIKAKSHFLESLIEQSPLPTFVIDSEGICVMLNKAFLKAYNVPKKEMVLGRNALTEPANVRQGVVKYIKEALSGKIVETPEIEFISPYEKKRTVTKSKLFPIFDATNKLRNVVVIHEDITARKRAEEALRKAYDELEMRVEERTAELAKANEELWIEITERKGAEEALQESEKKYRTTFENTGTAMAIIEEDTTISLVNHQFEILTGYSKEEIEGKKGWTEFVHEEDLERMKEYHRKRRESGGKAPAEYEFRFVDREGNMKNIFLTVEVIPGTKRSITSLMDITEYKRAEEALRESEGKYRDLADLLPQTVFEMDERGNLTFANRSAFAIFGYAQSDFDRGLNALQMFIPEDRDRAEENIQKVLSGEGKTGNEYTAQKKDGGTFPCIIYSSPIIHENKHVGLRGIIVDITERKKAEELYMTLANSSQVGVYIVQDGKVQFVNPKFEEYTGFSQDELLGTDPLRLVHSEDRKMVRKSAVKMLKGKRSSPYEFRIITKGGEIRWIMETVTSIRYRGERAVLGNYMDITEQKEARNRLEELEALESSVLDAVPHAVIGLHERRIVFANGGVEAVFGWRPEELIGKTTRVLYRSEEEYDEIARRAYPMLERQQTYSLEFPCRRKDGRDIICLASASRIGERLEERKVVVTYEDITEQKQAEEELRSSEERLRILFEFAPDACYLNDLKGNFVDGNKAAEEMIGYKKEELIGKSFLKLKLLSVKQTPKAAVLLAKNALGQPTGPDEFTLNRKDGSQVSVGIRTFPVRIKEQTLVLGIARDITERKKMEETLRVEKERVEEYLNIAGVMLGAVDTDENITLMNKKGYEILGYKEGELRGRNWFDLLVPQRMRAEIRGVFCSLMAGDIEPVEHYENPLLTKDGEERLIAFHNTVIKNANGQIVGVLLSGEDITERKRAEEALRQSEERYRTLFESKLDGVCVIDETMKLLLANQAAADMFGFDSVEEMLDVNPFDFIPRKERERLLAIVTKGMFEKDLQQVNEFQLMTKAGKEIWLNAVGARIEYQGKSAGLVSFMDITERKRAEQELRESEVRYRALVEAGAVMGEAIVLLQNTGKVEAAHLFANDEWARMTGYTPEELREISYFDLIHPRDRDAVAGRVRRRFEGEHFPGRWEICIIDKDGREVPMEAAGTPITYQGKPAVVGHIRDISERKKAVEEIKHQRKYFQALFESSPEAVASLDAQNRVVGINPAFEKIFGYTSEDIKGKDIDDCIVPRSRKEEGRSFSRRAYGGEVVVAESIRKRADGREIPVSILATPITINGKREGMFAIYRDITERKKAEEQLERSFVDLAAIVSRAMESRDPYTSGHQRRVAELARLVGEKMGLDEDKLRGLYIGGLLHDIGKISIPGDILSKPGELTDEEWNLIRAHAKQGYQILKDTDLPWPVADMALHHHERLDGSGYPHGISGDKLSLENRILGVCDVVEAMSSHRPYRPARRKEEVLKEIRGGRGTKYDADVVDIMLEMIESGKLELFSQT